MSNVAWTKPQAPGRRTLGVLAGVVVLFNLPLLHYYLVRGQVPATVTLPYQNDFSNPGSVEADFFSTGGLWRAQGGELLSPGVKNNPLWLKASLPDDVAVEFDARAMTPDGDVRAEIFGDGSDHASGYVLIHSLPGRAPSVLARLDEGAPLLTSPPTSERARYRVETTSRPAQPGRTEHWRIERQGHRLSWFINGELLLSLDDPYALKGRGHDRFGLSTWESTVSFDNLRVAPPGALSAARAPASMPAEAPQAFTDDFERAELGPDWVATGPDAVHLEGGHLSVAMAHNRPVWLAHPIPDDAVIEFETWTDDPRADIKVEAWGDGHSFYAGDLRLAYTATGYVAIFGGWSNSESVLVRREEHGAARAERKDLRVEPGRHYRMRLERSGGHIEWYLDGQKVMAVEDPQPLRGEGQRGFGFSGWETKVNFDHLTITPK
jgi:hypothetical protein